MLNGIQVVLDDPNPGVPAQTRTAEMYHEMYKNDRDEKVREQAARRGP